MDSLFLNKETSIAVNLHPVVAISILDHHLRRNEDQPRVIGTLLGTVSSGVVEVTNCYPVHHQEKGDEVQVGRPASAKMLALHRRVNPAEVVVGWYATSVDGKYISDFTCAIHDFYSQECPMPIHLVVDTSLRESRIGIHSYVCTPNPLLNRVMVQFQEIKVNMATSDAEKIGVDVMVKGREVSKGSGVRSLASDMDQLESSMERLLGLLDSAKGYVDDVVAGKVAADVSIGRMIAETLAAVPRIDAEAFHKIFHTSLQDLLMVVYLSNLTRAQLALAEKIKTLT